MFTCPQKEFLCRIVLFKMPACPWSKKPPTSLPGKPLFINTLTEAPQPNGFNIIFSKIKISFSPEKTNKVAKGTDPA
jgi:hypothetical protein